MSEKSIDILKKLVYAGAKNKNLRLSDTALDRLQLELSVIEKQDYADYLICYSRIINICNQLNIFRSPGRASAPGSLVNYCLDITQINPLAYGLLFERFINSEIKTAPVIDIDIEVGNQEKIIHKLKEQYPEYNSYFIGFTSKKDRPSKKIYHNDIEYYRHPCGIIITKESLNESTISYKNQSYYISDDIANDPRNEDRFNLLELKYLSQIKQIVQRIGSNYAPNKIPFFDNDTFIFLARGDNDNLFQFSSPGMSKILSLFKPGTLNDLSLINAVYRPISLDNLKHIIMNKGKKYDNFQSKILNKLLAESYGILVYQETFSEILNQVAYFTLDEAEIIRKKLFKAKPIEFPRIFADFFDEFTRRSGELSTSDLKKIKTMFWQIKKPFNKSHALCYSLIGYWGAFYKTHFNKEFEEIFNEQPSPPC